MTAEQIYLKLFNPSSYDYRTVPQIARNTSRAFMLEYCVKTIVYGAILEQNARFRPISGRLRRSEVIDLGGHPNRKK